MILQKPKSRGKHRRKNLKNGAASVTEKVAKEMTEEIMTTKKQCTEKVRLDTYFFHFESHLPNSAISVVVV